MNRTAVVSSTIRSVGYDAASEVLEVEFKSGGLYQYSMVSQNVFNQLMSAPSKGKYFDTFIRDKFKTRKIR